MDGEYITVAPYLYYDCIECTQNCRIKYYRLTILYSIALGIGQGQIEPKIRGKKMVKVKVKVKEKIKVKVKVVTQVR